jgi:putative restriction endonuclease
MRGFVANTDYDWYTFLRSVEPPVDEVNFWKPGSDTAFKALQPGEPLLFKLKAPHNAIAGFGFFAHYSTLPVSMAWDVYGPANGAPTFETMRERLLSIRNRFGMETGPKDFWIGCILVNQPVFFDPIDWVGMPADWSGNIVQGKGYDLATGEGDRIWLECLARARSRLAVSAEQPTNAAYLGGGYGGPAIQFPRLGQRSFRIAVLDSYGRRCAVTSERTLPALEAAHIQPFSALPEHSVNNGILFRADIHRLFDSGYVTVTPEFRFLVSRKIKEEFENGRDYYRLNGENIRLPAKPADQPLRDSLVWHNEERFLG